MISLLFRKIFDAADVLRLGKDLIVQHNFNTNRKGIEWLRRHTKSRGYRVHEIHFPGETIPCHTGMCLLLITIVDFVYCASYKTLAKIYHK